MAVLLPHLQLTARVRAHPFARDEWGAPVAPAEPAVERGPYPCAGRETPAAEVGLTGEPARWSFRLDPAMWPLEPGDEITDGARTWVISSASLSAVPGVPDVDHVVVTAQLDPLKVP